MIRDKSAKKIDKKAGKEQAKPLKGVIAFAPPSFRRERGLIKRGVWPVAGCDEAGRGPLAGPVVAAAVVLDPKRIPKGIDDSKRLTAERRDRPPATPLPWALPSSPRTLSPSRFRSTRGRICRSHHPGPRRDRSASPLPRGWKASRTLHSGGA